MLDRFKFSDILNILSIGSMFLLFILYVFYRIYPGETVDFWEELNIKETVTLILVTGALISIPLARIISAFVESLMYPVEVKGVAKYRIKLLHRIKAIYRKIFFHLPSESGLSQKKVIFKQIKAETEFGSLTRANIDKVFKLDVSKMNEDDFQDLYLLIKSYASMNNSGDLYFIQYSTVYNYHARLAIVFNIGSILTGVVCIHNFILNGSTNWHLDFFLSIIFYILGIYFASTLKSYGERQVELMVYDFNAKCCSFERK